jgi:hypothetical protein
MIAMTLTGKVPTLKLADNSFSKSIQKFENASRRSQPSQPVDRVVLSCLGGELNVSGMGTCYETTVTYIFSQIIASRICSHYP